MITAYSFKVFLNYSICLIYLVLLKKNLCRKIVHPGFPLIAVKKEIFAFILFFSLVFRRMGQPAVMGCFLGGFVIHLIGFFTGLDLTHELSLEPETIFIPQGRALAMLADAFGNAACTLLASRLNKLNGAGGAVLDTSTFEPKPSEKRLLTDGEPVSCDLPPDPKPRPTASTHGDIHLRTFDGSSYDNQATGEFLLFSVPVTAGAAGILTFVSDPADALPLHDIGLFGRDEPVPADQVDYGSTTIEIVGDESPQIVSVSSSAPLSSKAAEGEIVLLEAQFVADPAGGQIAATIDWGDGTIKLVSCP